MNRNTNPMGNNQYKNIPNEYSVTEDGKVFNYNRQLRGWKQNGYTAVNINGKQIYVHRLVAQKYIPNPHNKKCVNHINGIKTDNRVENLEWVTIAENNKHAKQTGLWIYKLANPLGINQYTKNK